MTIQKTKPVLVFDVNETLLDMTPLKKSVNALLDNEQVPHLVWHIITLLHCIE
jgi:hypothetical protein